MRRLLKLGYGLYALFAMVLVMFAWSIPLILLPSLRLRRNMGRWGVRLGLSAALLPLRVRGWRHLPKGPCLVASNHASYLDGLVLTAALPPRFTFVAYDGARNWPYAGLVLQRMGASFISRSSMRDGARQTRALIRRLQNGDSLTVFPEGGFEREAALRSFRKGAFVMAANAGVPVVPAVIRGTRKLLGDGQYLPRFSPVEIEFFPPLRASGKGREAVLRLRDQTRAVVLAHCGEPDHGHRHAHR
ncbi:MAG: 1-acyl-sn-glycerol-3-phosphate acyltransferase [Nevskiales bacterium]|nr:1-acyl-sn-glycerol-3-phosphate acyltransferase [Nevskiales bacterium]